MQQPPLVEMFARPLHLPDHAPHFLELVFLFFPLPDKELLCPRDQLGSFAACEYLCILVNQHWTVLVGIVSPLEHVASVASQDVV